MSEFFAIIFGENQYYQYKICDILANSFNGVVNDDYAFLGIRYYFPVTSENNRYYIEDKNINWEFTINGESLSEKRVLKSGDYIRLTNNDISLAILVIEYNKCSLSSKLYELEDNAVYFIGRSEEMHIVLNTTAGISRKHAAIRTGANGSAFIEDISAKTGVYVNGHRVENYQLKAGDHIFIMGVSLIYFNKMLIIPSFAVINNMNPVTNLMSVPPSAVGENALYIRTPRIWKTPDKEPIEIDNPTQMQKYKELPFILTAGPSMTMAFAMLVSLGVSVSRVLAAKDYTSAIPSGVMAVSMLLGALLWPNLLRSYNKRLAEANEKFRQKRYREYLSDKEKEIHSSYVRNIRVWNEVLYPDCENLIDIVSKGDRHLWERTNKDEDFLGVRLGIGQKPFEVDVVMQKKGFELEDDILKSEAYELVNKYKIMKDVPITLSLMTYKVVGIVGDYNIIAQNIITNLVSLYSPDELKLILVYGPNQEKQLRIFNDLPHTWSSDRKSRYVAVSVAESYSLFGELDEKLKAREEVVGKDDIRTPHYVVLSFNQSIIDSIPFKKTLVDEDNGLGVSAIFFGERFNQIPKECRAIVQKNDEVCNMYIKNENNNRPVPFKPDDLSEQAITNLVRGLSGIRIKREKSQADVPERVSFLEVYQVGNVEDLNIASHWNSNTSNKSLAAPIGIMAGGDRFYLDIHEKYHGCHGLVAGTTGSGKSEFLQAYILSMMINYSPKEVAFVLVDFKGGDMARPFLNSPHLAATISNLSGNTLYRALVSLEAEVKSRQRIFNESASLLGIDKIDINSYHKYYKEQRLEKALPHLIIVIDEFAQLKTQHPEFMAKLIDVAQVGRSLGIHLILATQKPNGVVDPQIWSNSRFKVCLKVMDKQDSSDMINKPLAAMIKLPGRAYVQVGYDEIFELIQSGYSGAEYIPQNAFIDEESITVSMLNGPAERIREAKDIVRGEKTDLTQLEAIMKTMARLGRELKAEAKKLWLNPLPEQLRLETLHDDSSYFGSVVCGTLDLPHVQKQINYEINFIKDGHLAIYGSTGTGKTTLIHTIFYAMAVKNSPSTFNSFIIDFNGGSLISLSKMPHCVQYLTDESEAKVNKALKVIEQIISERRAKFVEANCAGYESYLETGNQDMPIILVVIDNYASFREKMYKCEELVVQNIAAARACGIYFIITGSSKGAIYYKVIDHISNIIVFNMNDTGSYRDILNIRIPVFPENIKGRGLVVHNKIVAEMQVALPFDTESEASRMQQINAYYHSLKEKYGKLTSYSIPDDSNPDFFEDGEDEPIYQKQEMNRYEGSGDNNVIIFGKDIQTGVSIDFSLDSQKLGFIANKNDDIRLISYICGQLADSGKSFKVYSKRFEKLGVLEKSNIANIDEYVSSLELKTNVLVIDGFADLYDEISNETLEILEKALRNNNEMIVITIDNMERITAYRDTELYLRLVKCDFGVIVGGRADNTLAYQLNDEFCKIPEEYRYIGLEDSQALVYYRDSASFIELGGMV